MDPKHTAFENCLRYVLEGAPLEEALARYPVWADELRPMLEAALAVRLINQEIRVPRGALLRSRARLLREAVERSQPQRRSILYAPLRWSFAALLVIFVLVFGGFTTVAIAAQALPGEPLYAIKIMTEKTRLQLANDPAQQLKLQQSFDRERVEEVDALIGEGRSTKVEFVGGLAHMGSDAWTVNGISVRISPSTEIEGEIKEGFHIGVEGILQPDGSVAAARVWDRRFQVSGLAQVIARSYWVVDNVRIAIGRDTTYSGAYGPGSRVIVSAGKLLNGQLMARSIEILSVPGVILSNTDTPVPTDTVSPTAAPTETEASSPTTVPEERATVTEMQGNKEVETAEPTEGEEQETPEPTEAVEGEEQETPEPTEAEEGEEEESPEPTEEEDPTKTPKPTESHADDDDRSDPPSTPESDPTEVETE